ncbi:hypothetical protein KXR94_21210 [Stutzerimonas stutzeri]
MPQARGPRRQQLRSHGHRDRVTRKKRWGETEEDTTYTGKELDKSVVNVSQIRQVIQAMKTAVETQILPARAKKYPRP